MNRFVLKIICTSLLLMGSPLAGRSPKTVELSAEKDAQCNVLTFPAQYDFATWGEGKQACYLADLNVLERYSHMQNSAAIQKEISDRLLEIRGMVGASQNSSENPLGVDVNLLRKDGYVAKSAINEIVRRARKVRVVVINEAHYDARHRRFVAALLPSLRSIGFDHFAAEAFNASPSEFSSSIRQGVPTSSTGYYTRDPAFGNLVRVAIKLGYRLVPYELDSAEMASASSSASFQTARESGQAQHLLSRGLDGKQRAKFIVLVGFDHVEKRQPQRALPSQARMAEYLWKSLGEDILTIDQTSSETPETQVAGTSSCVLSMPTILQRHGIDGSFGRYRGLVDATVVHPCPAKDVKWFNSFPSATKTALTRVHCTGLKAGELALIQAFSYWDTQDAVPFDQRLISDTRATGILRLPLGQRLRFRCLIH